MRQRYNRVLHSEITYDENENKRLNEKKDAMYEDFIEAVKREKDLESNLKTFHLQWQSSHEANSNLIQKVKMKFSLF